MGGAQRGILGAQRIDLRGEELKVPRGRGVGLVPRLRGLSLKPTAALTQLARSRASTTVVWPFDAASASAPVPWLVETLAEAPSASARCTAARSPISAASRRSVEVAAASGCAPEAMEKTSLV